MKEHYCAWLVASVLSSVCGAGTDPRLDMTATLQAVKPNPSLGDQANFLARLVGTWDVDYTDYLKDGSTLRRTGEFTIGWIMDGRAIQDVWIVDPWGTHVEREVYTEVHYFEPKSRTWQAVFVDPQEGSIARLTSTELSKDRYVLVTHDLGGKDTRWSFSDIRPDSFEWRDETSSDGGKTWSLHSDYHMKRHGALSP